MPKSDSTKVLNPITNRCVSKTGKLGKTLLKITCDPSKVLNPATNRCVSKTGKLGTTLLKDPNPATNQCKDMNRCASIETYASLTTFDYSLALQMNRIVISRLKELHDQWINNKNKYALFEANYLVDYYCSLTVVIGDVTKPYIKNPKSTDMAVREFPWAGADKKGTMSHPEILMKNLSYSKGFKLAKGKMEDYVQKVEYELKLLGVSRSKREFPSYALAAIKKVRGKEEVYYPGSHGMYRLINMHYIQNKKVVVSNVNPCNCICYSLRTLMALYLVGIPKKRLYLHPQKVSGHARITHWAVTCDNMNMYTIPTLDSLPKPTFSSSDAFMYFTRNIITYYITATKTFKLSQSAERTATLRSFFILFDQEFSHGIQTAKLSH